MGLISYPLQDERREAVRQLVDAFVRVWVLSDSGPAHIALADYNLLDEHLTSCIERTKSALEGTASAQDKDTYKGHPRAELVATIKFLESLQTIPDEWRDVHAETEDDDDE